MPIQHCLNWVLWYSKNDLIKSNGMHIITATTIILILTCQGTKGQQKDQEDWSYSPPTNEFVTIALASYKGLPRFGILDDSQFTKKPVRVPRGEQNVGVLETANTYSRGLQNYYLMLRLKYLKPFMKDLDTERLTKITKNQTREQQNSIFIQNFLRHQLAPGICLSEACKNAGQGSNEFEWQRNYKTFVTTNLEPLLHWSDHFFEDEEMMAYYVSPLNLGRHYDFDQKGYWVTDRIGQIPVFSPKKNAKDNVLFQPRSSFEQALNGNLEQGSYVNFLLPIEETTAERFQVEGVTQLYMVKKLKISHNPEKVAAIHQPLRFTYSYAVPEFWIYEDTGLTKLVAKLSIENLTLKKR